MKFLSFLFLIFCSLFSYSQNVGIGTNTPDSSAALEIKSSSQGFLPPRLTTTQRNAITNPAIGLQIYNTTSDCLEIFAKERWQSIYCATAAPTPTNTDTTIITDIDGNAYSTVKICNQTWTAKNLNVSHYRNGDIIPQVTDPAIWPTITTGAWCWYDNDSTNYGANYGKLYNWYAVNDPRGLAPEGWHVPSDGEWTILTNCLGGSSVAGGKMKETGTNFWASPNTGATNSSGFSALPAGLRHYPGSFEAVGTKVYFWSSANYIYRGLDYDLNSVTYRNDGNYNYGFSVRCIKDPIPGSLTNGLVAYYPFNGNAYDVSGYGNNGNVYGASLTTDRFENNANAYSFDGINDLISIAHSNAQLIFGANQNSTISLWVKKSNNSDVDVISKGWHTDAGCTVGNQYLGLGYANPPNAYNFMLYDGDLSHLNNWRTNSNPNDTLWHNLIIIRAAQPKFYLDGIESTNIISNLGYNLDHNYFLTNSPLTIGARNNHDNNCNVYYNYYFAGKIDDIRFYNRALTQEEITYLATH